MLPRVLSKIQAFKDSKRGGFIELFREQLEEIASFASEDTAVQF